MEKQIKGGYILVSLGLIALSTSYTGSIDYDRISRTKKHIVLTGIKIADTVMPDICVKPVYGNGTITFEDVYGYDIVISSNNSVSVSEHPQSISGTKLYKHTISNLINGLTLVMINTDANSIDFSTINSFPKLFINYLESTNVVKMYYANSGFDVFVDSEAASVFILMLDSADVVPSITKTFTFDTATDKVTEL